LKPIRVLCIFKEKQAYSSFQFLKRVKSQVIGLISDVSNTYQKKYAIGDLALIGLRITNIYELNYGYIFIHGIK